MGTNSYDQKSNCFCCVPFKETKNDEPEIFDADSTTGLYWKEEKKKWLELNKQLLQLNEKLHNRLYRLKKEKSDVLNRCLQRNDHLEETVKNLKNELSILRSEKENERRIYCSLKATSENQWLQLYSVFNERATLQRKLDELKETNEELEAENVVLKLQIAENELQRTQDNLDLLELQSKLDVITKTVDTYCSDSEDN